MNLNSLIRVSSRGGWGGGKLPPPKEKEKEREKEREMREQHIFGYYDIICK